MVCSRDLVALGMQFGLDGELDSILKVWLLRGYNVGVFLWTQFADEKITNFVHTEDQIYTTGGFVKMRYRVQKNVTKRAPASVATTTKHILRFWRLPKTNR